LGIAEGGYRIADWGLRIADFGFGIWNLEFWKLDLGPNGLADFVIQFPISTHEIRNPQSAIQYPQSAIRNKYPQSVIQSEVSNEQKILS
jgi:hypothetical protein